MFNKILFQQTRMDIRINPENVDTRDVLSGMNQDTLATPRKNVRRTYFFRAGETFPQALARHDADVFGRILPGNTISGNTEIKQTLITVSVCYRYCVFMLFEKDIIV